MYDEFLPVKIETMYLISDDDIKQQMRSIWFIHYVLSKKEKFYYPLLVCLTRQYDSLRGTLFHRQHQLAVYYEADIRKEVRSLVVDEQEFWNFMLKAMEIMGEEYWLFEAHFRAKVCTVGMADD